MTEMTETQKKLKKQKELKQIAVDILDDDYLTYMLDALIEFTADCCDKSNYIDAVGRFALKNDINLYSDVDDNGIRNTEAYDSIVDLFKAIYG